MDRQAGCVHAHTRAHARDGGTDRYRLDGQACVCACRLYGFFYIWCAAMAEAQKVLLLLRLCLFIVSGEEKKRNDRTKQKVRRLVSPVGPNDVNPGCIVIIAARGGEENFLSIYLGPPF